MFSDDDTGIKQFVAEISVKPEVVPIFRKAYSIAYALMDKVNVELNKMQSQGIIYPVKHSEWASPIVVVTKKDGTIRICTDFKTTVNKVIEMDVYPIPHINDILASLSGGKYFTVIDLSGAYQQLKIGYRSQKYFTINTHLGLFRYSRLTYGISSAPAIFQKTMDQILRGIEGVCCYLDDILITGNSLADCEKKVFEVFARLAEYNVKINHSKCQFFLSSVTYLGHIIDECGIHPSKEKSEAILEAAKPADAKQLKSFLGLLNYYSKFLPMLSTVLKPLYVLTSWSSSGRRSAMKLFVSPSCYW